jgi:hypothetical protein
MGRGSSVTVAELLRTLTVAGGNVQHAMVWSWSGILSEGRALLRFLAVHTGLPVTVVAALLAIASYRVLKRTARFAFQVAALALALVAASELGWIRW